MPPRTMLRVVSLLPSATEVLPVFSILLAHLSVCPITLDVPARLDIPSPNYGRLALGSKTYAWRVGTADDIRERKMYSLPLTQLTPPNPIFLPCNALHATNPSVPMREWGTAGPPSPAHSSHRSCKHQTSDSARKAPKL